MKNKFEKHSPNARNTYGRVFKLFFKIQTLKDGTAR